PVPVARMALPWDPVHAVVMNIPLADWSSDPALAQTLGDLLRALLPRVEVIGLYHEEDYRLLADWLGEMENDPRVAPHLEHLSLLATEVDLLWARDYVPHFGRGENGRLVAVDPSFFPARRLMNNLQNAKSAFDPLDQYFSLRDGAAELQDRRGADLAGAFLVPFIEARWQVPTALSRPPIYLLGGDFLLVDDETALISPETLAENGGRSAAFAGHVRDYFGIEEVITLENLPGDTIEHLDFLLQPMGPHTFVVASVPESFGGERTYHRFLERELRARLERNRARLEARFPEHRFVEVPMPPPLLDDEARVVDELFLHSVQRIAAERGYPFEPEEGNGLDPRALDFRLRTAVQTATGLSDWNDPAARRQAVSRYLGQPIEELIARHVEEQLRYRSYVNSLLLRTADGAAAILVPRYRPSNSAEAPLIARLEAQAAAAYREAIPGVEVLWIDCTSIADYLGAIHCLTATIPDFAALGVGPTDE
ncbi:MAG: agmatine deiminase family protein, partial [Opitutales bacterium]